MKCIAWVGLGVTLLGCGAEGRVGGRHEPCYGNGTCDVGLACVDGLCVRSGDPGTPPALGDGGPGVAPPWNADGGPDRPDDGVDAGTPPVVLPPSGPLTCARGPMDGDQLFGEFPATNILRDEDGLVLVGVHGERQESWIGRVGNDLSHRSDAWASGLAMSAAFVGRDLVLAGMRYDSRGTSPWIARVTPEGVLAAPPTFSAAGEGSRFFGVASAPDGYLLAGAHVELGHAVLWLLRVGADGRTVYDRTYPRSCCSDFPQRVTRLEDGFAVVGIEVNDSDGAQQVRALRINETGDPVWQRSYDITGSVDAGHAIATLPGGDLIVTGATGDHGWVARLRVGSGDVVWERVLPAVGVDVYPSALSVAPDGMIFVGGSSTRELHSGFVLHVLSPDGEERAALHDDVGRALHRAVALGDGRVALFGMAETTDGRRAWLGTLTCTPTAP